MARKQIKKTRLPPAPETDEEEVAANRVRYLLDSLPFSADSVVQAATVNSVLFGRAIQYRRDQLSTRNQAKMNLEMIQASAELKIRQDARKNDEKITEAGVKALVALDEGVIQIMQVLNQAEEGDELAKNLIEAYRMRRDCLKIVADLTRDEMRNSAGVDAALDVAETLRRNMKKRYPGAE